MSTEFMTVKEASVFLGMSETNVGRLGRDGVLPSCKIGGARRFPLQQIREWLDARTTGKAVTAPGVTNYKPQYETRDNWIDLIQ
jgi:excisionase family DNA binding protein